MREDRYQKAARALIDSGRYAEVAELLRKLDELTKEKKDNASNH
jgi:RNA polymerase-interacting CarD/CdnL/TRCF family regulator